MKVQESYNTPLEHTPGNPPFANYERNPDISCWKKVARGVFQRCVETTLEKGEPGKFLKIFAMTSDCDRLDLSPPTHDFLARGKWLGF